MKPTILRLSFRFSLVLLAMPLRAATPMRVLLDDVTSSHGCQGQAICSIRQPRADGAL
jgi:hypothetical protein